MGCVAGRVVRGIASVGAQSRDGPALSWLQENKKISAGLKVVDWKPSVTGDLSLPGVLARNFGRALGLSFAEGLLEATEKTLTPERLKLDGMLFVWQPTT